MDRARGTGGGEGLTPLDELLRQAQGEEGGVAAQYQQLLDTAPPEVIARAHADAFARLPEGERRRIVEELRAANADPNQAFHFPGLTGGDEDYDPERMAAMFGRAQEQQPDLLANALGARGGTGASNPLMQMVLAGVAALVMRQLTGGAASGNTGQFGGGGLGDILGQVLASGGAAGGLGGAVGGGAGQRGGAASAPDPAGGGLGDLLGQLAGGGGGGLGAILGQLAAGLGGVQGAAESDEAPPRRQGRS